MKLISEVLKELNISEEEYENTLKFFDDIDIQPVFDYYKAVTYICSYLSEQKDECSQAMKQTLKEPLEKIAGSNGQMKSVAHAY